MKKSQKCKVGLCSLSMVVSIFIIGLFAFSANIQAYVPPMNDPMASANAGPDQTITLPASSATLSGSSTGVDGFAVYYTWTKLSGSGNIFSSNQPVTSVTNLSLGTSVFRLTATNNTGTTVYDDMSIFVVPGSPSSNTLTANAGPDQTITLPTSSVLLSGSVTNIDSANISYGWIKVSGSGTISSPTSAQTTVTGLTQGTSLFRLKVSNGLSAAASDDVYIFVNPAVTTNINGSGATQWTNGTNSNGSSGYYLCSPGTTGTYPNCVAAPYNPSALLISIPSAGIRKTSGLDAIKNLQLFLNWNLGSKIIPLVVDGRWGAKTTAAIKMYQGTNTLKADGYFGKLSAGKARTLLQTAGMLKQ